MTGNIAPRNFRKQAKASHHGEPQQNAAAGPFVIGMQIICIYRLPAKTSGRRTAMLNSCKELVMPVEKHQHHGRQPVVAYYPGEL